MTLFFISNKTIKLNMMVSFSVHYLVKSVKLHNDIQQVAHKLLFGKEDLYGFFSSNGDQYSL